MASKKEKQEIFAENLRVYMSANGYSQTKLAAVMGVNKSSVSDWMNGESMPRKDRLKQLHAIFGIPDDTLIKPMEEYTGEFIVMDLNYYTEMAKEKLSVLNDTGRAAAMAILDELKYDIRYNDAFLNKIKK